MQIAALFSGHWSRKVRVDTIGEVKCSFAPVCRRSLPASFDDDIGVTYFRVDAGDGFAAVGGGVGFADALWERGLGAVGPIKGGRGRKG